MVQDGPKQRIQKVNVREKEEKGSNRMSKNSPRSVNKKLTSCSIRNPAIIGQGIAIKRQAT